jgi:outer membrane protein OmpA-like peptidoglycan-associated protein
MPVAQKRSLKKLFSQFLLGSLIIWTHSSSLSAQDFSSYEIIQGLARPGGIGRPLSPGLGSKSGILAPLAIDTAELAVTSVEDRGLLRSLLAAYAPPSVEMEIMFRLGSAELDQMAYPDLAVVAQALASVELSSTQILIAGHTDNVGGAELNLDLSLRRAIAVRDHLVQRFGISEERLVVTGFGFERLKDFLDPESPVNRRVEFVNATGLFE